MSTRKASGHQLVPRRIPENQEMHETSDFRIHVAYFLGSFSAQKNVQKSRPLVSRQLEVGDHRGCPEHASSRRTGAFFLEMADGEVELLRGEEAVLNQEQQGTPKWSPVVVHDRQGVVCSTTAPVSKDGDEEADGVVEAVLGLQSGFCRVLNLKLHAVAGRVVPQGRRPARHQAATLGEHGLAGDLRLTRGMDARALIDLLAPSRLAR